MTKIAHANHPIVAKFIELCKRDGMKFGYYERTNAPAYKGGYWQFVGATSRKLESALCDFLAAHGVEVGSRVFDLAFRPLPNDTKFGLIRFNRANNIVSMWLAEAPKPRSAKKQKFDPMAQRVTSVKAARDYLRSIGIHTVGAPVENGVNIIKFNVKGKPMDIFRLLDSYNPSDEDEGSGDFMAAILAGQGYGSKFGKGAMNGFWCDARGMSANDDHSREIHLEHTSRTTCTISLSHDTL